MLIVPAAPAGLATACATPSLREACVKLCTRAAAACAVYPQPTCAAYTAPCAKLAPPPATAKPTPAAITVPTPAAKVIDWKLGMSAAEQSLTVVVNQRFKFEWTGHHNVYVFPSKAAYEACDFTGAKPVSVKPLTMASGAPGTFYYGCEIVSHCKFGQKIAVTVVGTFVCLHMIQTDVALRGNFLFFPSENLLLFALIFHSPSLYLHPPPRSS